MMCCAGCGIGEEDDIKLKKCSACYLVRYCSVQCQKEHRSQHKQNCKKRAAELFDELLFKQPESTHDGDCHICCLPLPTNDGKKCTIMPCCSQLVCNGCIYANDMRKGTNHKCPFCQQARALNQEEADTYIMKRVKVDDPVALQQVGLRCYIEGKYNNAFEHLTKAAKLGDAQSHFFLSFLYRNGQGVEEDKKKELHHLEEAAIGGHQFARHNLGCMECDNGRLDRAVKHWNISAILGHDKSVEMLKQVHMKGLVSKEDFATTLHAYQAAIDATKSSQREEAEDYLQRRGM